MKKILKKTIAMLCACLTLFSVAACGEEENKTPAGGNGGSTGNGGGDTNEEVVYDNPNHDYTAKDTTKDLVANGKTDYVLVYPENSTSYENTARKEFIDLFREATGIKMTAVPDTDLTYDENAKYISLGDTKVLETSGVDIEKAKLGDDGVRIITKGNTVFLGGGRKRGPIYAVYDFMSIMFNYETYFTDCMVIDQNVTDAKLKDFDVTDIPDFKQRVRSYAPYRSNDSATATFINRMRQNSTRSSSFPMYKTYNSSSAASLTGHNTNTVLNRDIYTAEGHEEWFSDNGNQLCYTAHGDEEEWSLMVDEIVKKCLNSLQFHTEAANPDYNTFDIIMEDNGEGCTCSACNTNTAKYGAQSGSVVLVMNEVAKRYKEEYTRLKEEAAQTPDAIENTWYTRDVDEFMFQFYSYLYTVAAPAVRNPETGEMEPSAPEMVLDDSVTVTLALSNLSTCYSLLDPLNTAGKNTVDGWAAVSNNLGYWIYTTNFHMFMYPWYDFTFTNSVSYGYMYEKSDYMMYSQAWCRGEGWMTNWYNLRMYIDAKLQWDTSLDVDELVDNWFEAMYQDPETVKIMKALYQENVDMARSVIVQYGSPFNFMGSYIDKDMYWPYQTLQGWMDRIDLAHESIAKYKGTEKYETLRKHIEIEAIGVMYMMMDMHSLMMSTNKKTEIVNRMLDGISSMNLYKMQTVEQTVLVYEIVLGWQKEL